jgi:COP9 signalosome complex subunit 6
MATRNRKYNLVDESVSETSPHILLHPLVLVSQDDHATRFNVRKQGPIIGAILGQQNGKEITMEFAFECGSEKLLIQDDDVALDYEWFSDMLVLCEYLDYPLTFTVLTI